MSPEVVGLIEPIVEPLSIRRRRPGGFAVIAGIESVTAVMPLVVPAVPGLGHDQPESVVQDIRGVGPKPCAPSGIANAKRVIGNVSV
jgi:hypothetical protein